ncbi:MAG TPA: TlpA disulfide reductase family protein [Myxococcota bacterium]|nr:TlpA disulfide reductase family protein [Myxococcota bacterium]HNZ03135.1 TlpA disulfide reductase family protein [Myxococcota bacterium]HOH77141.1 TlpA disulfide reductase family protein [Myxococcota bacterium]
MSLPRFRLIIFTASILAIFLADGRSFANPGAQKVKVGDLVSAGKLDIKLRDLGKGWFWRVSEMSYPGRSVGPKPKKIVVLDFFSTNCVSCKKMLPALKVFSEQYKDKVQVLLVAVPENGDVGGKKLRAFFEREPMPFPVLEDPSAYYSKKWLPEVNGKAEMPCLFLIDREGIVRAQAPGYHESIADALSPALESALKL